MKHTTDQATVKAKMKATFKHRQELLHDPDQSSLILDHFPRFLDTPGLVRNLGQPELPCTALCCILQTYCVPDIIFLCVVKIDQDFTMLFGENVSGKFVSKWPTFYKPRIITICKGLRPGPHLDDLLSAQEASNEYGKWTWMVVWFCFCFQRDIVCNIHFLGAFMCIFGSLLIVYCKHAKHGWEKHPILLCQLLKWFATCCCEPFRFVLQCDIIAGDHRQKESLSMTLMVSVHFFHLWCKPLHIGLFVRVGRSGRLQFICI